MIYALNAGFGQPLPIEDLVLIRSLGYEAIRQDVLSADWAPALVDNILRGDLRGIFVVPVAKESECHAIAHVVSRRAVELQQGGLVILEVGNEEDLAGKRWSRDPVGWSMLVSDVATIASDHSSIAPGGSVRVVSGGISCLSRQAISWLSRSRVRQIPVGVGYHQYRSTIPVLPLEGYSSRAEEFRALDGAAGGQPTWMTECGWHTARRSSGTWPFRKTWSYTDTQVAEFLREELARNEEAGARSFVTYQLNDGPDPSNDQDCFGIRRTDGTLKPSATILLR